MPMSMSMSMSMSDITNVYGYDLSELLTNEDLKIDDNDEDFKHILTSFRQLSADSSTEMNNCKVVKPMLNKRKCKDKSSIHNRPSHNHVYLNYVQIPNRFNWTCGKESAGYRNRFPTKLFKLLDKSEASGYSHIISWLPHGRSFKIHDEKLFNQHVLNEFFKSSPQTFKRQLHMYGFKKIGKRFPDVGAYFHKHFIIVTQMSHG